MMLIIYIIFIVMVFKVNAQNNYMNFTDIATYNTECKNHYDKYVLPYQERHDNVPFDEYLEYWWNLDESDQELVERVCTMLYNKFPKLNIRRGMMY